MIEAVQEWVKNFPRDDVDGVVIAMRPSPTRNAIVTETAKLRLPIILHPPAFSDVKELLDLRESLGEENEKYVTLYANRRFARGVEEARKRREDLQPLSSISLEMGSGRYPIGERWVSEFASHFFDVLFNLGVGTGEFTEIELQACCAVTEAPVISFTGMGHRPNPVSVKPNPVVFSGVLSANRSWQISSHADIFLTGNKQLLKITQNLATLESYAQDSPFSEVSDYSHDTSSSLLFGGHPLISEVFSSQRTPQTATLSSYILTQLFTDRFVDLLTEAYNSEKSFSTCVETFSYCSREKQWILRKK